MLILSGKTKLDILGLGSLLQLENPREKATDNKRVAKTDLLILRFYHLVIVGLLGCTTQDRVYP